MYLYETYATINLDAIKHNIKVLKECMHESEIMAVLKGDGYGQGAKEILEALYEEGIEYFAVANLMEALDLRKINSKANILVLGRISGGNLKIAIENEITITIFSDQTLKELIDFYEVENSKPCKIHIKLNSGFNRLGFTCLGNLLENISVLQNHNKILVEGIYSHFALTNLEEDEKQFEKFIKAVEEIKMMGIEPKFIHIADSIAAVDYPWARLDMVRLGSVMYGLTTNREAYDKLDLKSSLSLTSSINQVNELEDGDGVGYDYTFVSKGKSKVATVAIGYADGVPRCIGNNGQVLFRGKAVNVIGIVCMDQIVIDVTGFEDVKVGEEVLIYDIDRKSPVSVEKLSKVCGTNKNEIVSRLGKRVTKVYIKNNEIHKVKFWGE